MANHWIQKRGSYYVIVQKGTNKVLSRHRSKSSAEASFRAMEMNKHGGTFTRRKPVAKARKRKT